MRATAESPLDPRACRRVKLLISNYRHTAHLRRTGHETVAHVYQYRFGRKPKAVTVRAPAAAPPPGGGPPPPVPRCGVSYKSDITVRRFLRLRGRGCIYTQKPVSIHAHRCVYMEYAHPLCIHAPVPLAYTHPLAGVNAPNTAYKHIRVNAASGA